MDSNLPPDSLDLDEPLPEQQAGEEEQTHIWRHLRDTKDFVSFLEETKMELANRLGTLAFSNQVHLMQALAIEMNTLTKVIKKIKGGKYDR